MGYRMTVWSCHCAPVWAFPAPPDRYNATDPASPAQLPSTYHNTAIQNPAPKPSKLIAAQITPVINDTTRYANIFSVPCIHLWAEQK
jgi:hypothetical protein